MTTAPAAVGIVGAGPIGAGLTHNLVRHGIPVALYSRSPQRPAEARSSAPQPRLVTLAESATALTEMLSTPRVIITAVSDAGTPEVLETLLGILAEGDVVIDVSNAGARETQERQRAYAEKSVHLLAGGLASGGYGAAHGISLTVSGDRDAFDHMRSALETISAQIDGPCVQYLGDGSSSHLVKTIHNGLEYSVMQLLAEVVMVLRDLCALDADEIAATLQSWNASIGSYIITVAADAALMCTPPSDDTPVMDTVEDRVDHNGSGARAAVHAMSGNVFNPSAAISILARLNSDLGDTQSPRPAASTRAVLSHDAARVAFTDAMAVVHRDALEHLRAAAAKDNSFDAQLVWNTWRGATIASAFHAALSGSGANQTPGKEVSPEWRAVVAAAATNGVGIPMLSGLLNFLAAQRAPRSYASVLQLMRHQLGGSEYSLFASPAEIATWPTADAEPTYTGLGLCEGPFWDVEQQRLSWVDIDRGSLFVSDGRTFSEVHLGKTVGAAIPVAGVADSWLVANGDTLGITTSDGHFEPVWRGSACCRHGRFNDAKCDPHGRVFAGRICAAGDHAGDLLRLNDDGTTDVVIDDVALSNGMCWSLDGKTMYFVDSKRYTITAYDYDPSEGRPGNPRSVKKFSGKAEPDGLSIDSDGALWIAMWGGSEVIRLSPEGSILNRISFSHRFPTSCTFGGNNLDRLYVTFAADDERGTDGFVGELHTGYKGVPQTKYVRTESR